MEPRSLIQLFTGLFAAFISVTILFGGFALSLAETGKRFGSPEASATAVLKSTLTSSFSEASPFPSPLNFNSQCVPPPDWTLYKVKPEDTIFKLSQTFSVSTTQIQLANCLDPATPIFAGQQIYLPPLPDETPCGCSPQIQQPSAPITTLPAETEPAAIPGPSSPTPPLSQPLVTETPALYIPIVRGVE